MWWTSEIAQSKCYCLIWIQRHVCTLALLHFSRSGFNTVMAISRNGSSVRDPLQMNLLQQTKTRKQIVGSKLMHEPSSVSLIVLHSPRQMTKDLVLILFERQQQQKHGRRELQRMILITELNGKQSKCKMPMFLHNFYGLTSSVQIDCASRECASM